MAPFIFLVGDLREVLLPDLIYAVFGHSLSTPDISPAGSSGRKLAGKRYDEPKACMHRHGLAYLFTPCIREKQRGSDLLLPLRDFLLGWCPPINLWMAFEIFV
jgi:hypothetical protein